jgi:hypothetical protein
LDQIELGAVTAPAANGSSDAPHIPTRAEARQKRQQEQIGFQYPLPYTGGVAHVRIPSLATITNYAGLPTEAQERVLRVFRDAAAEGAGASMALTWDRLGKNQERQIEIANALVVAGFIAPQVRFSDDQIDPGDPHMLTVDDLHVDEKLGFLNLCIGQNRAEAARLEPFPVAGIRRLETVSPDAAHPITAESSVTAETPGL